MFRIMLMFMCCICLNNCNTKNYQVEIINGKKTHKNSGQPTVKLEFAIDSSSVIRYTDSTLKSPCSYAISQSGVVYVVDQSTSQIFKFDPNGKLELKFAGKGTGPGEFVSVGTRANLFCVGDTVVYADLLTKRYLYYNKNGVFIKYVSFFDSAPCLQLEKLENNYFVAMNETKEKNNGITKKTVSIILAKDDFKIIKSIKDCSTVQKDGQSVNSFDRYLYFTANDSNIFVSNNDNNKYTIDVSNHKGELTCIIEKSYKCVPYSKETQEEDGIDQDKRDVVKYKKPINALFVDMQNRLLVFTPKKDNELANKGIKFDVFKNGKFLNSIFLDIPYDGVSSLFCNFKIYENKLFILDRENALVKNVKFAIYEK